MRRISYLLHLSIIFLAICFNSCQEKEEELPNIIIIFTDDQGYADLGCYGADGFETPNIDKLAEEGMRFTSFYVSEAVCSASRSSLLTGCYAQRVSIRGALNAISYTGLHPEETTIASILRGRGYKTAIFGKWHLGHHPEFLPANFGFDEYFGLPYSNDMWPVDYDGVSLSKGFKGLYPALHLIEDSIKIKEIQTLRDQEDLTTLYTHRAVDFIHRNKNNPFFLYLPHSMVHVPLAVSDKYKGSSQQGLYGDVMMEIDWSVGEIVTALEDNGIENNTLIIYTSDNGPWLNYGNHGGSALPLREGKGTAWEGGVRVPCVIKWPGSITGGRVCHELATSLDILPTIAAITDATMPDKEIDGMDMTSLLLSDSIGPIREEFLYFYEGGLRAVRKGKWKLMLPHKSRSYNGLEPGTDGYPGPVNYIEVLQALYNLDKDMSETMDVSDKHPDVVNELLELADKARYELGDNITNIRGANVRECGRIGGIDSTQNLAKGKIISLIQPPAPKYRGEGPETLINGKLGSFDFLDGQWLGFRDNDLEANIDLGKSHQITDISIRFLQNQTSWIFLPSEVEFQISDDGQDFSQVFVESFENEVEDLQIKIGDVIFDKSVTTRFLKIKAKHIGNCPDWHPGRSSKGWLFVDEVILK